MSESIVSDETDTHSNAWAMGGLGASSIVEEDFKKNVKRQCMQLWIHMAHLAVMVVLQAPLGLVM